MIENGFTNLYTEDMSRALAFYAGTLGFRETFRIPQEDPDHVELCVGGVAIALSTCEAARRHQGVHPDPGAPAMCLTLWTLDLDAAFAAVRGTGARVVHGPREAGNGNCSALARGPDGNLVELVSKSALAQP